jgi:hypothetical protein
VAEKVTTMASVVPKLSADFVFVGAASVFGVRACCFANVTVTRETAGEARMVPGDVPSVQPTIVCVVVSASVVVAVVVVIVIVVVVVGSVVVVVVVVECCNFLVFFCNLLGEFLVGGR